MWPGFIFSSVLTASGVVWYVRWALLFRLKWIEISEEGISYKVGSAVKCVNRAEAIEFKRPPAAEGIDWGDPDILLVSKAGSIRLNSSIERVSELVNRIKEVYNLPNN